MLTGHLPLVTEELPPIAGPLDAGDVGAAVRLLRMNAERAALPKVAALLHGRHGALLLGRLLWGLAYRRTPGRRTAITMQTSVLQPL